MKVKTPPVVAQFGVPGVPEYLTGFDEHEAAEHVPLMVVVAVSPLSVHLYPTGIVHILTEAAVMDGEINYMSILCGWIVGCSKLNKMLWLVIRPRLLQSVRTCA